MMKKYYVLLGVFSTLISLCCFGDYVAQDFTSPRTGQSTVFWGDSSKGKDAYVLEYNKETDKYYFEKVEKNKPVAKNNTENIVNNKSESEKNLKKVEKK